MSPPMRVPVRRAQMLKNRDDNKGAQYLTPAGVERMKDELKRLEREQPLAVEEVVRTGAMGDFSENAEYQEAKYKLRRTNDRIASLKEKLKNVIVIRQPAEGASTSGRIEIGSTVVLRVNDQLKTYQIVGSSESSPARGRISFVSPLGSALMDRMAGEKVTLETGHGGVVYEIIEVK